MDTTNRQLLEKHSALLSVERQPYLRTLQTLGIYTSNLPSVQQQEDTITVSNTVIDEDDEEECCCVHNTILISEDYEVHQDDWYIGVNSEEAVEIKLPEYSTKCGILYIKAEAKPPLGNRKVTISGKIDNKSSIVLSVPYSSVTLIFSVDSWHLIS